MAAHSSGSTYCRMTECRDDRQFAVVAGFEHFRQPLRCPPRGNRDRLAGGDRQGGPHPIDPVQLVGPDVGEQRDRLAVGFRRVERREVAAGARGHPERGRGGVELDRGRRDPRVLEPQRRGRIAELAAVDAIRVTVGQQVEPGARADLEQPDRPPVPVRQP